MATVPLITCLVQDLDLVLSSWVEDLQFQAQHSHFQEFLVHLYPVQDLLIGIMFINHNIDNDYNDDNDENYKSENDDSDDNDDNEDNDDDDDDDDDNDDNFDDDDDDDDDDDVDTDDDDDTSGNEKTPC